MELIPKGTYWFKAIDARLKKSPFQPCRYIEVTLECLDQKAERKKLWEKFYIEHENMKTETSSKKRLSAFLKAAGHHANHLYSVDEIKGLTVKARVSVHEHPPYPKRNTVKKWILDNIKKTA